MTAVGLNPWMAPQTLSQMNFALMTVRDEATSLYQHASLDDYGRELGELADRYGGTIINFSNTDMAVYNGFGILFMGQSGVGKTTLAKTFERLHGARWVAMDHIQLLKIGGGLIGGKDPHSVFTHKDISPPQFGLISSIVFVSNQEEDLAGRAYGTLREASKDYYYAHLLGEKVGYDISSLHLLGFPVTIDLMNKINVANMMSKMPPRIRDLDFIEGAEFPYPEELTAMSAAVFSHIDQLVEQIKT